MPDQKDTLDATRGDSFGWLAMMGGMPVFGARFIPIFRRIYNPGNNWQPITVVYLNPDQHSDEKRSRKEPSVKLKKAA